MSVKELNQVVVFEKLKAREMKQKEAAKILKLSTRQIRKKLREFRKSGTISLIHKSRGKPSNNQLDPEIEKRSLNQLPPLEAVVWFQPERLMLIL